MTPERWIRVKEVFHLAVETPPSRREQHVRELAGADEGLAQEVLSLLRADSEGSELRNPILPGGGAAASASEALDTIGKTFGSYRLLERAGQGGMGVVYRAFDERRRRTVALKTLLHSSPERLHLFKKEFQGFADLAHPNLVQLHELISDGSRWCLTMEFVDGIPLPAFVEQSPGRFRDAFRQLARGVSALHSAGRLHCDLKPSNVLVTREGRVVILDFGISRELSTGSVNTTDDQAFGTPAFLAPEQVLGARPTAASDWYSFGTILFQALTGRLPFAGPQLVTLQEKTSREAPAPREIDPDVPSDLDGLCVNLLSRDPASRPLGPEVMAALGDSTPPLTRPTTRDNPFVGRESELEKLREAYEAVCAGSSRLVHVHGPSGAGKTALVRHFLSSVGGNVPPVVLGGRCHEQEFLPFKAFDSVVDSLVQYLRRLTPLELSSLLPRDIRALARVFPALLRVPRVDSYPATGSSEASAPELRRKAGLALRELLARIGDRRPVVLHIDDLHWGDADSASLLMDLLTPPDAPVFLGIGCYRNEIANEGAFLAGLRASSSRASGLLEDHIALEPLSPDQTRTLVRRLLEGDGKQAGAEVEHIVAESAGRPFLVYDLIEHVAEIGGQADFSGLSLNQILWRRIESLPADCRRLIEIVAIAGRPIEPLLAAQAAGFSFDDKAVRILRANRLLRATPTSSASSHDIEVYHDRVRQSVLNHLNNHEIVTSHERLAEALRGTGSHDAERIALHLDQAGRKSEAAQLYANAAEDACQSLSFEQAAILYRRAIELGSWQPAQYARLRVGLADALNNAGRGAEAAREYLAGAAVESDSARVDLQHRAALALLKTGHVDEGLEQLRPVLKPAKLWLAGAPWTALVSLLAHRTRLRLRGTSFNERTEDSIPPAVLRRIDIGWSVVVGLSIIDPIRGADFQTRSLLLALDAGEPFRVARALAVEAAHLAGGGDIQRAKRVLEEANRLAVRIQHPYSSAMTELTRGTIAYFDERWQDSLEASRNAAIAFRERCTGSHWEVDTANAFSLWSWAKMGEIRELSRHSPAMLKEAHERGNLYAIANLSTQIMAMVRLGADDPGGARDALNSVMRQWSQTGYHVQHHDALLARVMVELYSGDYKSAWDRVQAEWAAFRWSLLSQVQDLRIEMLQLRAYCALAMAGSAGDRDPFISSAARDARRLRRERLPWTFALAEYIEGAIAHLEGREEQALGKLISSARGFDSLRAGLHAAATRVRLAQLGARDAEALEMQATGWFERQQIRAPERMVDAFAPGFRFRESPASSLSETRRQGRT